MKLYEKDYTNLTAKEKAVIKKISGKKVLGLKSLLAIPQFYFFSTSHFPNNMLDVHELQTEKAKNVIKSFRRLLKNPNVNERDVVGFVKNNRAYFIIASVLCHYDFGHHGAYLFPEFELSTNHVVDYLVVGMNSGGHEFIFIELESVYGGITLDDGSYGASTRRGIKQIEDWQFWLEKNFKNLNSQFEKYKNKTELLPSEYFEFDQTRMHYIVISGRRQDYNAVTYRKRRKLLKESDTRLMHYDNLIDCAKVVSSNGNYV